jgi:hypothetical protein
MIPLRINRITVELYDFGTALDSEGISLYHQKQNVMKKFIFTSVLALLLAGGTALSAQNYPKEYLGLPGDNLNLYAVMDLFRESATLEIFEKSLNDPDKMINNLDLNGDQYVDYLIVKDYLDGRVHNIVISAAINATEYQDVAVFTVEKFNNGSVQIQLIGDEALYGRNYIIEPNYAETPNPGYKGNTGNTGTGQVVTTTYYQVAAWPAIRYIFLPTYVIWHSPWHYGYYPAYWSYWRPHYWHYYYGYHYNWHSHYYGYYRSCNHYRYNRYHDYYHKSVRHHSPRVASGIRSGNYKSTYSRPEEQSRGQNHYDRVYGSRNSNTGGTATPGNQSGTSGRRGVDNTNAPNNAPSVRESGNRPSTSASSRNSVSGNTRSNSAAPAVRETRTESREAMPKRSDASAPARSPEVRSERKSATPATRNAPAPRVNTNETKRGASASKGSSSAPSAKSGSQVSSRSQTSNSGNSGSRSGVKSSSPGTSRATPPSGSSSRGSSRQGSSR